MRHIHCSIFTCHFQCQFTFYLHFHLLFMYEAAMWNRFCEFIFFSSNHMISYVCVCLMQKGARIHQISCLFLFVFEIHLRKCLRCCSIFSRYADNTNQREFLLMFQFQLFGLIKVSEITLCHFVLNMFMFRKFTFYNFMVLI